MIEKIFKRMFLKDDLKFVSLKNIMWGNLELERQKEIE